MSDHSPAPGELEQVRTFLNTWLLPNDTREPVDELPDLVRDRETWVEALPSINRPRRGPAADTVRTLQHLRDDLRLALGQVRPEGLEERLRPLRWLVGIGSNDEEPVTLAGEPQTTETSLLAIVMAAVGNGTWHRLRACPDCAWVFYDWSRNARRTWCSMDTSGGARGCGSIAKTRAYRLRQRAAAGRPNNA